MVMTGAALVLAGSVGVAAAVGWSARTGMFGEPGMTENDTTEWLFSGAGDYGRVVRDLVPQDLPLPPGRQVEDLVAQQVEVGRREPAMVQETGVRGTAVFWAMCVWQQEWLEADARGDAGAARRAVDALRALPERAELAAVDGGGVVDRHRQLAESAAAGNRPEIRRDTALNCTAWVP